MTGPEEKQRCFVERFMAHVPHLKRLGIGFRAFGDDWAEMELPYAEHLVAYPESGVMASGAIFSLMDSCAGMSVLNAAKRFEPHATLDLRMDYLRPATPGATVIARARCYKASKRVAFVRGVAHEGDPDRAVAHATGTFMFTAV